jgi:hypothetical protein
MDGYAIILLSKVRIPGKWVSYNSRPYATEAEAQATLQHARLEWGADDDRPACVVPFRQLETTLILLNGERLTWALPS